MKAKVILGRVKPGKGRPTRRELHIEHDEEDRGEAEGVRSRLTEILPPGAILSSSCQRNLLKRRMDLGQLPKFALEGLEET